MIVKVRLHGILKDKIEFEKKPDSGMIDIEMPDEAVVSDLLPALGLPKALVGLILVDSCQVSFDYKLKNGDSIELFSPMCGGK